MKLWHLYPCDEGYSRNGLWGGPWEKAFGFVIRAASEAEARQLASGCCGEEGPEAWLDCCKSRCKELTVRGDTKVILKNFHAG